MLGKIDGRGVTMSFHTLGYHFQKTLDRFLLHLLLDLLHHNYVLRRQLVLVFPPFQRYQAISKFKHVTFLFQNIN